MKALRFFFSLVLTLPLLAGAEDIVKSAAKRPSSCDVVVSDVLELCSDIAEDYQAEVLDQFDEMRKSKNMTSMPAAARRLRAVRLTEASAARDYARECQSELNAVPMACRNHVDFVALSEEVTLAREEAVDFEVEAGKLQKIATSVSGSPEIKALNQILPSLLDILSGSPSPIMKSSVAPSVPRLPASEPKK